MGRKEGNNIRTIITQERRHKMLAASQIRNSFDKDNGKTVANKTIWSAITVSHVNTGGFIQTFCKQKKTDSQRKELYTRSSVAGFQQKRLSYTDTQNTNTLVCLSGTITRIFITKTVVQSVDNEMRCSDIEKILSRNCNSMMDSKGEGQKEGIVLLWHWYQLQFYIHSFLSEDIGSFR